MGSLFSTLNEAQRAAVTAPDGPVLVIAGAGTGKTHTLVHRLVWLASQGVNPASMLLLTFTRKASKEMLSRAESLLGRSIGKVQGGTFHSFAYSVLRRYRPAWATGAISVLDSTDSLAILQRCRQEAGIGKKDKSFPKNQSILNLISKARNKELPLMEIMRQDSPHLLIYAKEILWLEQAYSEYRRQHNLLDYDDLLFELEILLRGKEAPTNGEYSMDALAPSFQALYRYIVVDEYQDTNKVQARLVQLLSGKNGNVMVVGDDAQSIYAFRGATVRNILDFPKLFPKTKIVCLEENYRSVQPVLNIANAVLAESKENYHKKLFTVDKKQGALVRLVRPLSDTTQAILITARIKELLKTHKPCEIAVLFRAAYHSYRLEAVLTKEGIRFRKYGGLRYTEAAHIRDVLAYLRLLINPLDQPSFERLAVDAKGVGEKTADRLYTVIRKKEKPLQESLAKYPDLLEEMLFLEKLRLSLPTAPLLLLDQILLRYQPRLEKKFPEDWPYRKNGLEELAHIAASYDDVEAFLADLTLEAPDTYEPTSSDEDSVILSTVHSAKGLEWDAVLVIDLVEDRFPSRYASLRQEDFEEERRLMYVACTRAREILDLSAPLTISSFQYGEFPVRPSPFILHLPQTSFAEWRENAQGVLKKVSI